VKFCKCSSVTRDQPQSSLSLADWMGQSPETAALNVSGVGCQSKYAELGDPERVERQWTGRARR
jgi:hypothetical protein